MGHVTWMIMDETENHGTFLVEEEDSAVLLNIKKHGGTC